MRTPRSKSEKILSAIAAFSTASSVSAERDCAVIYAEDPVPMVSLRVREDDASIFETLLIAIMNMTPATESMPITSAIIAKWIFLPSVFFVFIRPSPPAAPPILIP